MFIDFRFTFLFLSLILLGWIDIETRVFSKPTSCYQYFGGDKNYPSFPVERKYTGQDCLTLNFGKTVGFFINGEPDVTLSYLSSWLDPASPYRVER